MLPAAAASCGGAAKPPAYHRIGHECASSVPAGLLSAANLPARMTFMSEGQKHMPYGASASHAHCSKSKLCLKWLLTATWSNKIRAALSRDPGMAVLRMLAGFLIMLSGCVCYSLQYPMYKQ